MKNCILIILMFFLVGQIYAQTNILLKPNGEVTNLKSVNDLREAIKASKVKSSKGVEATSVFPTRNTPSGVADTLNYRRLGGKWNTDFGFHGQDVMFVWFEAIADMTIKGIGFTCSSIEESSQVTVSPRLIRLNWTEEQMKNFKSTQHMGYYSSSGDSFNEVDPFGEEATGNWISVDPNNPLPPWTNNIDPNQNTWNYDLWQMDSNQSMTAVSSDLKNPIYNWHIFDEDGNQEIQIQSGDIFAVVLFHNGTTLDGDRIGFWADNTIGIPCWKFYENGRTVSDVDPGWWVRMYTWDFAVIAELVNGPLAQFKLEELPTTLSTDDRTVQCEIIGSAVGEYNGITSAKVVYQINDGLEQYSEMAYISNFQWEGLIPGQQPGTEITYTVEATTVQGLTSRAGRIITYNIFEPLEENLVVINGNIGWPDAYYFGQDSSLYHFPHDSWSYGPLTLELLDHYIDLYEFTQGGPDVRNDEVIREWINSDGMRDYFLAGDEYLGWDRGYADIGFNPGDFEYDILGLTQPYNDVSFDGISGQEIPSKLTIHDVTIGSKMYKLWQTQITDSLQYDPNKELGVYNWHDGFDVREGTHVFMTAETRGIAGISEVREVFVGITRELGAGNKVAFMALDPLAINSSPEYYWYGFSETSPTVQATRWFYNYRPAVEENEGIPLRFELDQNFPNPFNPSTTISYSIPEQSLVELKVFDVLGREVAELVRKEQQDGNYEVQFDASALGSGVYFCQLRAGSFIESKKMILLK